MDAQQRLLLERSYEVLQQSTHMDGAARTSVAVGIGTVDYTSMASHLGMGIYVATGELQWLSCLPVQFTPAVCNSVDSLLPCSASMPDVHLLTVGLWF